MRSFAISGSGVRLRTIFATLVLEYFVLLKNVTENKLKNVKIYTEKKKSN